jgi:phosphoribosylformylglycinamidine synthase
LRRTITQLPYLLFQELQQVREGEIRDEGATGRGAKPKIGLVGFNVSNLRIPNLDRDWEQSESKPERIASPLSIMIEGPLGAAAFNNEFGRPSTLGILQVF